MVPKNIKNKDQKANGSDENAPPNTGAIKKVPLATRAILGSGASLPLQVHDANKAFNGIGGALEKYNNTKVMKMNYAHAVRKAHEVSQPIAMSKTITARAPIKSYDNSDVSLCNKLVNMNIGNTHARAVIAGTKRQIRSSSSVDYPYSELFSGQGLNEVLTNYNIRLNDSMEAYLRRRNYNPVHPYNVIRIPSKPTFNEVSRLSFNYPNETLRNLEYNLRNILPSSIPFIRSPNALTWHPEMTGWIPAERMNAFLLQSKQLMQNYIEELQFSPGQILIIKPVLLYHAEYLCAKIIFNNHLKTNGSLQLTDDEVPLSARIFATLNQLKPSDHVLVRSVKNSLWYRAIVLQMDTSSRFCVVYFMDLGKVYNVPLRNVAKLDDERAKIPPKTFFFDLADIKMPSYHTKFQFKATIDNMRIIFLGKHHNVRIAAIYQNRVYINFIHTGIKYALNRLVVQRKLLHLPLSDRIPLKNDEPQSEDLLEDNSKEEEIDNADNEIKTECELVEPNPLPEIASVKEDKEQQTDECENEQN